MIRSFVTVFGSLRRNVQIGRFNDPQVGSGLQKRQGWWFLPVSFSVKRQLISSFTSSVIDTSFIYLSILVRIFDLVDESIGNLVDIITQQ
tara:strand:- start:181 stop:450 length:270 start_codon:yes stop_codon:yes gene_type:complete